MTYGYARISRKQQNIERQVRNILAAYPDAAIRQEAFTGTKIDRPVFDKMIADAKRERAEGKPVTIVFDSVSRMSRNAEDGWKLYQELYSLGIELVFLKERNIDTAIFRQAQQASIATVGDEVADLYIQATNKALMILAQRQVKLAFDQAQKEVDDLHERTKEGIKTARLNGKQIGGKTGVKLTVKKEAPAKAVIMKHSKDFGGSLNDADCMKLAGLARNTYYKYKRELKAKGYTISIEQQ